jgi:hypothetical protein
MYIGLSAPFGLTAPACIEQVVVAVDNISEVPHFASPVFQLKNPEISVAVQVEGMGTVGIYSTIFDFIGPCSRLSRHIEFSSLMGCLRRLPEQLDMWCCICTNMSRQV